MKNKIWILFIIISIPIQSQSLKILNDKFEINNNLENEYECRVYIFEALSRNVTLYRIFKESDWNSKKYKYNAYDEESDSENEIIQYYDESEIDSEESIIEEFELDYNIPIKKIDNLDKYWKRIIESNITLIPDFKNTFFEKTVVEYKNGKKYSKRIPIPPTTDGYYYIIQIKNKEIITKSEINNPKHYISIIPENENLKSLSKFITIIEEIFEIKN